MKTPVPRSTRLSLAILVALALLVALQVGGSPLPSGLPRTLEYLPFVGR